MMRKILFFINSEVGGAERMGVLISRFVENAGYEVKYAIVADSHNKTSITDFISKEHKVYVLSANSRNYICKFIKFYKVIKEVKPDFVFSTNYSINDKILLLKPFFRGVKFIIRSDFYYSSFSRLEKMIIRASYRQADLLIAQTDEMRDEFIEHKVLPADCVITLENPVDKESIESKLKGINSPYPNDGKKHIVAVGRVSYQKGYDILAESFADLIKESIDAELYIVGSYEGMWASEYNRVVNRINQLGIGKKIHFVGYQDNPYQFVKYADLFVLSSRWEGLPNVLAEALYLKIPIAASKCIPIIERMVRDKVDGYLAEKDNPKMLSIAMKKALTMGRTNPVYCGASPAEIAQAFDNL